MVLGHSTEDVENIIRSAVGGDYVDTFRLYDEVIETEYVRSKAMYEQVNAHFTPYEQNYELQQLTNALIQQYLFWAYIQKMPQLVRRTHVPLCS